MTRFNLILFYFSFVFLVVLTSCQNNSNQPQKEPTILKETIFFVGTYTEKEAHVHGKADGIYVCKMDDKTGKLTYLSTAPDVINPSYLTVHPTGQFLYAVNEIGNPEGFISSFKIDSESYELTFLNKVSANGKAPCYISMDQSGQYVLVANYVTGNVVMLPIASDGKLGEAVAAIPHEGKGTHPRQEAPHVHFIAETPQSNGFAYAVDLGIDQIKRYQIDAKNGGLLSAGTVFLTNKEAGSRHLAWHPSGRWMYVINELDGTIEAFEQKQNKDSLLTSIQVIPTLPEQSKAASCADIHLTPNGQFLYATNRGEFNNIAMYRVNANTGQLTFLGNQSTKGKTPRNFIISKDGQFLLVANQDSDTIVTFKINQETGVLEDIGLELGIKTPVCLQFL